MTSLKVNLAWLAVAAAAFHLAYGYLSLSFLMLVYLLGLLQLAEARTGRHAFYLGLACGLLTVGPQMSCFWAIFGPGAAALWLVLAFWIGLFVALARLSRIHLGPIRGAVLVPFIWTGLEYFRSELYYLRFSWLNIGYAFSGSMFLPVLKWLGVYGVSFLAVAVVNGARTYLSAGRYSRQSCGHLPAGLLEESSRGHKCPRSDPSIYFQCRSIAIFSALLVVILLILHASGTSGRTAATADKGVRVAGVQLEFPTDADAVAAGG